MKNQNATSRHLLHNRQCHRVETGVPHSAPFSLLSNFILLLLVFLLPLLWSPGSLSAEERLGGELDIHLSNTSLIFDEIMYVNITFSAENNTGNVTVLVKNPNDSPVLMESSLLVEGNASIEFSLFFSDPNGTYSVYASAITDDNQTFTAEPLLFNYENSTPSQEPPKPTDDPFFIPPEIIVVTAMTSLFLLMGQSTEKGKYGICWLIPVILYTRLRKKDALEDFNRGQIYRTINEHPGVRFSEIRKKVGIGNGVLTYHLKVLQNMKFVKGVGDKTLKRFYLWGETATLPPDLEKPFTPIQRAIVDYLSNNNWSTQKDMVDALHEKQQTISKSLKKLEQGNIVKRVKEIKVFRYNLTKGYLHWLSQQISPKCPTCMNVCRIGARFCENCGTKFNS